jgi:hypothetical protein
MKPLKVIFLISIFNIHYSFANECKDLTPTTLQNNRETMAFFENSRALSGKFPLVVLPGQRGKEYNSAFEYYEVYRKTMEKYQDIWRELFDALFYGSEEPGKNQFKISRLSAMELNVLNDVPTIKDLLRELKIKSLAELPAKLNADLAAARNSLAGSMPLAKGELMRKLMSSNPAYNILHDLIAPVQSMRMANVDQLREFTSDRRQIENGGPNAFRRFFEIYQNMGDETKPLRDSVSRSVYARFQILDPATNKDYYYQYQRRAEPKFEGARKGMTTAGGAVLETAGQAALREGFRMTHKLASNENLRKNCSHLILSNISKESIDSAYINIDSKCKPHLSDVFGDDYLSGNELEFPSVESLIERDFMITYRLNNDPLFCEVYQKKLNEAKGQIDLFKKQSPDISCPQGTIETVVKQKDERCNVETTTVFKKEGNKIRISGSFIIPSSAEELARQKSNPDFSINVDPRTLQMGSVITSDFDFNNAVPLDPKMSAVVYRANPMSFVNPKYNENACSLIKDRKKLGSWATTGKIAAVGQVAFLAKTSINEVIKKCGWKFDSNQNDSNGNPQLRPSVPAAK